MDILPVQQERFLKTVVSGVVAYRSTSSHTHVLICAQPKSAGLYLTQLLALSLDYSNHKIGFNKYGGDLYYPQMLSATFSGQNTISHCHSAPTPSVCQMIKMLRLRPLVLTRNLLDALVSRRDMLIRDEWTKEMLSAEAVDRFLSGTNEYQMDVVIDLFASEYINFFMSWVQYGRLFDVPTIFCRYNELITDEWTLVSRVAGELGETVSEKKVRDVSSSIKAVGGINLSTGTEGRGQALLSERQISLIREKARIHGCEDEGFLGFSL